MNKKILIALAIILIAGGVVGLYIHFKKTEAPADVSKIINKSQVTAGQELQKKMTERGEVEILESRYQAVIAIYEGMLKKSPDNAVIKKQLAETYIKLGNYQLENGNETEARKNLDRAKELQ